MSPRLRRYTPLSPNLKHYSVQIKARSFHNMDEPSACFKFRGVFRSRFCKWNTSLVEEVKQRWTKITQNNGAVCSTELLYEPKLNNTSSSTVYYEGPKWKKHQWKPLWSSLSNLSSLCNLAQSGKQHDRVWLHLISCHTPTNSAFVI